MEQNYLGKFLKLKSLNYPIIEYQLFNFSKESLKQIFLNSKCGEVISGKEFKDKPSNHHLVSSKSISPIYFVYKKAKPKIKCDKNILSWKESKIKKHVDILSNAYMNLSLLLLAEYYNELIKDEKIRKEVVKFYVSSAKCQLNYYINNFRNELGLFVNKNIIESSNNTKDSKLNFECNNMKFTFSSQAYLMVSFLKCSKMLKENSPYKIPFLNFSIEMENMFIEFQKEILKSKSKHIIETIEALVLYVLTKETPSDEISNVLYELIENFICNISITSLTAYEKINLYQSFLKLKTFLNKTNQENIGIKDLINEYIWEFESIFSKENFEKEEILNTYDLISYQIYLCKFKNEKSQKFYEETLLTSKIFSCFPNIPKNYESEKYFNFEHNKNNIIPDKYIKPYSYKTMDEVNITPIFYKCTLSNKNNNKFSKPKTKFNSLLNMKLIFLIISNLKDSIIKKMK